MKFNIYKKSYINVLMILAVMIGFSSVCTVAAEEGLTKAAVMNVAANKPVTGGGEHPDFPLSNLVDDDRGTFIVPETYLGGSATGAGDDWLQVDLQRRYKIEKIEFYDRYDVNSDGGRQFFDIIASNTPEFTDSSKYTIVGSMTALNDSVFPFKGCFKIELAGEEAYRYIRIKRTGGYYYGYSELKVFAQQTVTEVSRNKPAVADMSFSTGSYVFAPELAVNGTNLAASDLWLTDDISQYHFFRIDLGKEYPIGLIEMEGRNFSLDRVNDNPATRKYIDIYGSNSIASDEEHIENAYLTKEQGYNRLISLGERTPVDGYTAFPPVYATNAADQMGGFSATCDESTAFRYITYKKTYKSATALGQIKAFVVNPDVNKVLHEGKTIYLEFSDEMDAGTLNKNNVKIFHGVKELACSFETIDAYSCKLELDDAIFGGELIVEIGVAVANSKGVNLAQAYVKDIKIPLELEIKQFLIVDTVDGAGLELASLANAEEAGVSLTVKNNMPDKIENVIILAVLYNANNSMISVAEKRQTIAPLAEETLRTGLRLPEGELSGYKFIVYVWENFRQMKSWVECRSIEG